MPVLNHGQFSGVYFDLMPLYFLAQLISLHYLPPISTHVRLKGNCLDNVFVYFNFSLYT